MAITTTTAAALTAAAATIGAGSAIVGGFTSQAQAKAQAKVQEQQARRERLLAEQKERDFRRRQSAARARVRAATGARGIETGTGSELLASQDFDKEVEVQARRIREGGEVAATRLEQQADFTRARGTQALVGGGLSAASSLFSGFGRTARILADAG